MNPKGLVAAASISSKTSMPSSLQRYFASFTSAMFTVRKLFSKSFTASAVAEEFTGTTFSMIAS